jgi:phage anti-repressor protein
MNQLIPKTINFNELVKNSTTTLSLNLQTKLVQHLNDEFTEQEQQWYIANLFIYMNYHPTNDFPINLDHVYNMLGFANKGNAMKTIKNNFTKDEDYKISFLPKEKSSWGGSGGDKVMLNIDTFKNLCMLVKTDKGKQIRKYYVKLENIYNKLIKDEIEEQQNMLEEKNKMLEQTERELKQKEIEYKNQKKVLKATEKELTKYKEKTYEEVEKKESLYILQMDGGMKVGMTKRKTDLRLKDLQTGNVDKIEVLFDYKTSNAMLLEKLVHYILDRYRCNSNREFFNCDIEYIKQTIHICGGMMDTLKSSYQHIANEELYSKLKPIVEPPEYNSINSIDETIVSDITIEQDDGLWNWLDNTIEKCEEKSVLKLIDVVYLYTGDDTFSKFNNQILSYYKTQFQLYVKDRYPDIRHLQHCIRYNGKTYKGWSNLRFIEK